MTWKKHISGLFFFLSFFVSVTLATIGEINAQSSVSSDIVTNVEKRTWVKIPNEYTEKLNNFVATNEVMKSRNWVKFTEDFIVNEMQNNWGINKENQLLFIRSAVYKQITNKDLYDWSDWNDERLWEFMKVVSNVKKCWKDYVNWFNTYMQQRSAEADRRSAEADRRSADARQNTIEYINKSIDAIIDFYNSYKFSPDSKRLESFKSKAQEFVALCNKDWFDYKALLLKKLWDEKKLNDLLNLFEIE